MKPCCVGLRHLCALQLRAGAAELAIAQTVLALIHSKPLVLDNPKGDENQGKEERQKAKGERKVKTWLRDHEVIKFL